MASTDISTGNVGGLLAFLDFMVDKGYASQAAIAPWKSAARQVFEKVEGENYEQADARSFDIDEYLARFENRSIGSYSADSLRAYRSRFRRAVEAYRSYLADPNWRPTSRRTRRSSQVENIARPRESKRSQGRQASSLSTTTPSPASQSLIAYPFPLKSGQMAQLQLPTDLESEDAERLIHFVRALVFKQPKQPSAPPAAEDDE